MVVNMTSQVQGELFCDMEGAWWDVEGCKVELVRQYCDCNLYCIYQTEWDWLMRNIIVKIASFVTDQTWTLEFCTGPIGVCHLK